jgi:hypothetical protein
MKNKHQENEMYVEDNWQLSCEKYEAMCDV